MILSGLRLFSEHVIFDNLTALLGCPLGLLTLDVISCFIVATCYYWLNIMGPAYAAGLGLMVDL